MLGTRVLRCLHFLLFILNLLLGAFFLYFFDIGALVRSRFTFGKHIIIFDVALVDPLFLVQGLSFFLLLSLFYLDSLYIFFLSRIIIQDLVLRLMLALLDHDVCHLQRISKFWFLCFRGLNDFPRRERSKRLILAAKHLFHSGLVLNTITPSNDDVVYVSAFLYLNHVSDYCPSRPIWLDQHPLNRVQKKGRLSYQLRIQIHLHGPGSLCTLNVGFWTSVNS